jgi:hypothetical protein
MMRTPPMGWCSGENAFRVDVVDGDGKPLGAPVEASMVVQIVPLGILLLGMALATTDDRRIPEMQRAVSLTWVARPPRLTMAADPLAELGAQTLDNFAKFASQAFGQAVSTTPAEKEPEALGIG